MQKIIKKVIILLFAIIVCLMLTNVSFAEENNENNFVIENFEVELNVREDNKVEVKEIIDVKFLKQDSHGIYRAIPIWDKYTGNDGKTIDKRTKITDFKCDGEDIKDESSATMFRVKIGNPDRIVPEYKTYNISYTYDFGKDNYTDRDEFIFNAFGDSLNGGVPYGKITLKFAKGSSSETINKISKEKLSIWKDKYRKENIYENGKNNDTQTSVTVTDDGIVINLTNITGSITTEVILDQGYFTNVGDTYDNNSMILCFIIILIAVSSIVVWFFIGKDNKIEKSKNIYYPPDNLDPAYIGVVLGNIVTYNQYNALTVSLASKGYISIARDPKDKNNFFVKKLIDINKPLPNGIKELSENEKLIYESMFRGNEVIISLKDNKIDEKKLEQINKNTAKFREKIIEKKSSIIQIIYTVLSLISVIIYLIAFFAIKDMNPEHNYIYIITFIMVIVEIVFTFLIEKRTSYGDKLTGKIMSYKEFLKSFNKEQCEKLLKENPKYFYETLPYTYVLGVSKNWLKEINTYPDLARYCNVTYFQNLTVFLAYQCIFTNSTSNYGGGSGGSFGGLGGSSGVGSW